MAIAVTLVLPRGAWGAVVDRFNLRLVPVGYTLRQLVEAPVRRGSPPAPPPDTTLAGTGRESI